MNRYKQTWYIAIGLCVLSLLCCECSASVWYVSPDGNDAWAGTIASANPEKTNGPFATLERAKQAIRELKSKNQYPADGVTVYLKGGIYRLDSAFVLTEQDSGLAEGPVRYASFQDERAVLSGSIPVSGWKIYKGNIYQADLKKDDAAPLSFSQLYCRGAVQRRARVPNADSNDPLYGGYAYADANADEKDLQRLQYDPTQIDPSRWKTPQTGLVDIFCYPNYGNRRLPIEAVNLAEHTFRVAKPGVEGWTQKGDRFFVENIFEELDAPGEWYLDEAAQVLYFWPSDGKQPKDGEVQVPMAQTLIHLKGRSDAPVASVRFECLDIEASQKDAVLFESAKSCWLAGCSLKNIGGNAISLRGVCSDNRITSNTLRQIGNEGISIMGEVKANEKMRANEVSNNHITEVGTISCMQVGGIVLVAGSHNRIAHNEIHDTPRWGIILDVSNDTIVEYNHVYRVNQKTEDAGGINTGTFWGGLETHLDINNNAYVRGNIIRYNKVHDTGGYGRMKWWPDFFDAPVGQWCSPYFSFGIYLDLASSGTLVYGNLVYNVGNAGICLGGGNDNVVENNIFIGGRTCQIATVEWPQHLKMKNNRVEKNILAYAEPKSFLYWHGQQEAGHTWKPENIRYDSNVIWQENLKPSVRVTNEKMVDWEQWLKEGMDNHSLIADPQFKDPKNHNYNLKSDSPAYKLGFKPIPVDKIGLYTDPPYRLLNQ